MLQFLRHILLQALPPFTLLQRTNNVHFVLHCQNNTISFSRHHSEKPKEIFLHKTCTSVHTTVQTRAAHNLTSAQPPSRLNCSCLRSRESCAKQIVWGEGGRNSGDDRQISQLTGTEILLCNLETPSAVTIYSMYLPL